MSGVRWYTAEECDRKAQQHWEMAGMARADGDTPDANRHTSLARLWGKRAAEGGFQSSGQPERD